MMDHSSKQELDRIQHDLTMTLGMAEATRCLCLEGDIEISGTAQNGLMSLIVLLEDRLRANLDRLGDFTASNAQIKEVG